MDSLSQMILGASVAAAAAGRGVPLRRAALWGGLCGTAPDLDAFIDHGDAVLNMTLHRGASHSLLWLSVAAPIVAAAISATHRESARFRRWWLIVWLAFVTHPLLDAMTVYGTQLLLPFTNWPVAQGSIFIIDPLYTLPLLAGLLISLKRSKTTNSRHASTIGLAVSCLYLAWSVGAQTWVDARVRDALAMRGDAQAYSRSILITPSAFNTVLWRIVVPRENGYDEGFVSLLDGESAPRFETFPDESALRLSLSGLEPVARMERFARGFVRVAERDGLITIADLRMGQEPFYAFEFLVAERGPTGVVAVTPTRNVGGREGQDIAGTLRWTFWRALGKDLDPPR